MKFQRIAVLAAICASTSMACAQETNEVEQLRRQLREMQESFQRSQAEQKTQMEALQKQLEALSAPKRDQEGQLEPSALKPAGDTASPAPVSITAEKWKPSDPIRLQSGGAYLDVGLVGTFAAGGSTADDIEGGLELGGHDPNQRGFTVQGLEAAFSGAVDPYFRGQANILFSVDSDGESFVELEEAWLETLSLPAGLQLRAGQIMTEFGRQNAQHPHQWAFVDTPLVLGRYFGPDGLRNPGVRLSWLMPLAFYSQLSLTLQNSQGETASSFRSSGDHAHGDEEETELPFSYRPTDNDRGVEGVGDLLLTPRYTASFDLSDTQTLLAGASASFGPNSRGGEDAGDTTTQIYGLDFTWKWKPERHHGGFPFVQMQAEGLVRSYDAGSFDWSVESNGLNDDGLLLDAGGLPANLVGETLTDYGGYAQILYGFKKGWVAGLRGDYVSSDPAAYESGSYTFNGAAVSSRDPARAERWRLSPNLTWYPTEFSKIRLQYNYDDREMEGVDHSVWLQFEFVLGAHAAHTF
jgi:hypothetical protein